MCEVFLGVVCTWRVHQYVAFVSCAGWDWYAGCGGDAVDLTCVSCAQVDMAEARKLSQQQRSVASGLKDAGGGAGELCEGGAHKQWRVGGADKLCGVWEAGI